MGYKGAKLLHPTHPLVVNQVNQLIAIDDKATAIFMKKLLFIVHRNITSGLPIRSNVLKLGLKDTYLDYLFIFSYLKIKIIFAKNAAFKYFDHIFFNFLI